MEIRKLCVGLTLAVLVLPVVAADGLVVRAADSVWPQWHARIALQTASLMPLSELRWLDPSADQRGLKGGTVLGDYYFSGASFGAFRASGGLMMGAQGSALSSTAGTGARLGLAVSNVNTLAADNPGTLPYLGLGFTSAPPHSGLAITADVGLVAAGSVSRALFGNQGMDSALRELRLSPVLQLGLRYQF